MQEIARPWRELAEHIANIAVPAGLPLHAALPHGHRLRREHVRACEGETMFADVLQHESAVFIIAVGALFRQVESSLAAAESVAVTSDVALRHLSVDSDEWVARLPIVAKGTRLHHRDAHVEPPYRDVPLDIDGHSYAVA